MDAIQLLLDAGADINRPDQAGNQWTPLQHAIHKRETAAVRLLLDRSADPKRRAPRGSLTPLLMAAADRDPTVVKLLLAHGADPRVANDHGDTPLTRAVSGGALSDIDRPLLGGCHPKTVRALLDHDPTLRISHDFAGRLAVWWSRVHGCEEIIKLIGEQPTKPGQPIVAGIDLLRQGLRQTLRGAPAPPPATGALPRR